MVRRDELLAYINTLLNISEFDDYCTNGLQVEGTGDISRVVLGVSVSARLFLEAKKRKAELIITHHGLFWKNDPLPFSLTGIMRDRISILIKNDINLAAYHLPLDAHPEIGNNAQIARRLNLNQIEIIEMGARGKLGTPLPIDAFSQLVDKNLQTTSLTFPFGKEEVSSVFIMSGAAASAYPLALANNADIYITGEIKESHVRLFEEEKLNVIIAGHYNTERWGLMALATKLEENFDITCEFVEIPNPV